MTAQHTSTPWHVALSPGRGTLCILANDAWICGEISNGNGEEPGEGEANAAIIVRAVNAHDDLVEALKMAERLLKPLIGPEHIEWVEMQAITAALAKAEA